MKNWSTHCLKIEFNAISEKARVTKSVLIEVVLNGSIFATNVWMQWTLDGCNYEEVESDPPQETKILAWQTKKKNNLSEKRR